MVSSKVINFGCRLNTYEASVINSFIKKNKIDNTLIFNSCAVTNEAEKQVQQSIRKYKKLNPNSKIIVTGCAAQINPSKYLIMNEVDQVIGNDEKMKSSTWENLEKIERNFSTDIMNINTINKNIIENFDGRARAYIEIQQGCNHRCTFCTIPFGRGNNRSVPLGLIVERAKKLVLNGYNEIVLTGVDITDYGIDLPGQTSLSQMIKRLLKLVPDLKQLRLSSIDCAEIDNDFWDLIEFEKRLMPHLHISIQSGDDMILKRMKRRHNRKNVIEFCKKAKSLRPNIVFGADLIAGFPTENEEMFKRTCDIIDECDLTYLHVFPYSIRQNTPASKMPQISNEIKKKRSSILRNIGEVQHKKYLKKLIGKNSEVLIEKNINDYSMGKTQEFSAIKINSNLEEGKIYNILIKSVEEKTLIA
tara:strand:- start:320 stop:1570 length:1251 start_codon:yes stop_codon:yes gene_type:complete